jgi:hypothetical protein
VEFNFGSSVNFSSVGADLTEVRPRRVRAMLEKYYILLNYNYTI